ncbi:PadR family transcriptional regulator [Candidatus Woesearchaeota archaeon]|nr:PadR family transcriptional regulator [Candidatus Woesearchaeota archaeon]
MAKIKITNMLKFYTLCLLAEGPKHGYELIKELGRNLGRSISASNVYPFLEVLKKNRMIAIDKVGKRDKKIYHLTAEGRNFTRDMFSKFGDLIDVAIKPRIATCPCGCKIYSGGHSERIKGRLMKFCCSHCARMHKAKI